MIASNVFFFRRDGNTEWKEVDMSPAAGSHPPIRILHPTLYVVFAVVVV